MKVAIAECESCNDEWHIPDPNNVRDTCRECGEPLNVERKSVSP